MPEDNGTGKRQSLNLPRPSQRATTGLERDGEMPGPIAGTDGADTYMTVVQAAGIDPNDIYVRDRTPWLALPKMWPNLIFQVWVDYPKPIAELWTPQPGSGDDGKESPEEAGARLIEACTSTFLAHAIRKPGGRRDEPEPLLDANGQPVPWHDPKTSQPYPPITTEDFWEQISTPLSNAIIQAFFAEMASNPTSAAPSSRRTRRRR